MKSEMIKCLKFRNEEDYNKARDIHIANLERLGRLSKPSLNLIIDLEKSPTTTEDIKSAGIPFDECDM